MTKQTQPDAEPRIVVTRHDDGKSTVQYGQDQMVSIYPHDAEHVQVGFFCTRARRRTATRSGEHESGADVSQPHVPPPPVAGFDHSGCDHAYEICVQVVPANEFTRAMQVTESMRAAARAFPGDSRG